MQSLYTLYTCFVIEKHKYIVVGPSIVKMQVMYTFIISQESQRKQNGYNNMYSSTVQLHSLQYMTFYTS